MANSSFIQLPQDIKDPQQLRRFLDKLILQLDIAFGHRGDGGFSVDATNNPKQPSILNLNQTISNPPTQAEIQAISDKVDNILIALREANII